MTTTTLPMDGVKVLGRRDGMLVLGVAEEIEYSFLTQVEKLPPVTATHPVFSAVDEPLQTAAQML